MPTGGGKTVIFNHIAAKMAEAGKRVIILTHRKTLVRQTASKIYEAGVPHGVIAADYKEFLDEPVQVASVQTIAKRLDRIAARYPHVDLVVVDEAHHTTSDQFMNVLQRFCASGSKLLGVSATPTRLDGAALNPPYKTLVVGATEAELIAGGYLSDYALYLPPHMHDPLYNRTKKSEVTRAEREEAEQVEERTGDAVGLYKSHLSGKRAIAFCYSIADSMRVAQSFCASGIPAAAVSSDQTDYEIQKTLKAYSDGDVQVLCTCDLISEGFDVPETVGVLLMRKTESLTVFLQQIGRAMRPKEDGGKAVIVDMVNNAGRHGLPDDAREWTLEGKPKTSAVPSTRRCSYCFAVSPGYAKACRSCGLDFPVAHAAEEAAATGYEHDGIAQFAEVDKAEWRRIAELRGGELAEEVKNATTVRSLRLIAAARGLGEGWIKHAVEGKKRAGRRVT